MVFAVFEIKDELREKNWDIVTLSWSGRNC